MRDGQGRAIILRGVNLPNDYDQRGPDKQVRPPAEVFHHIADSGFNAVRLVIEWYQIEAQQGVYNQAYLELVRQHVQWAQEAGLFVFVDMHQDLFGRGFGGDGAPYWACDQSYYDSYKPGPVFILNYLSSQVRACFQKFWSTPALRHSHQSAARAAAELIAGYDHVLGFDTFNEPSLGTAAIPVFEPSLLLPFDEEFAAFVGEAIPGRAYFFEPTFSFTVSRQCFFEGPVTAFTGVFAPHYYNPSVEGMQLWDGDASAVHDVVALAADTAQRLQVPWILGEMGGSKFTPNLSEYLFTLYGELDRQMAGAFLWLYEKGDNGFHLIDQATNDWTPHARAFLRPVPSLVAGTPTAFTWDYAGGVFRFSWDADPTAGQTEIILPAWIVHVGFEVSVNGAPVTPQLNARGNRLILPAGRRGSTTLEMHVDGPYPG
ncbi:MAG: cellulase family glycosylhydrolase [Deltaproteobacteria bacterium]|nr:cellulase family glycosylhydrolase [Deltaproteobacteria bacterium]